MKHPIAQLVLSLSFVGLGLDGLCAQSSDVDITPDVVYGHKSGMALTFDVYTPSQTSGAAVIWMVSGGWRSSWRPAESGVRQFRSLLDEGFTVFRVRHGSSPKFYIPEIVADVRRSIRFIRLHAEDYSIDADRMGVYGGSAGGHLSLMLGTASDDGNPDARDEVDRTSNRIAAVVAYYPPVDLRPLALGPIQQASTGSRSRFPALHFDREQAPDYSPIVHVTSDDPPTLLIHGDEDALVPLSNSTRMLAALQEKNVATELIVIEGAGHGFRLPADRARSDKATVDWFVKHLAKK